MYHVLDCGWCGVDLFFVLSGFLITGVLLRARDAENYYSIFYIRRGLRIFPLYYGVLVLALLLLYKHGIGYPFRIEAFYWLNLSNLVMAFAPMAIPSLTHFWSLAIEEQFYFVWPAVIRRLTPGGIIRVCIGVIGGLFLVRNLPVVLAWNHHWSDLVYRMTIFRVDTMCAGALLAVLSELNPEFIRMKRQIPWALFFVGAGAFLLLEPYQDLMVRFGYSSLVLCFTSLLLLALSPRGCISRFCSNKFLRLTGKYSYCFYLLHPFVIGFVLNHRRVYQWIPGARHFHSQWLCIGLVSFVIVFTLCALSSRFIQGPILSQKRHFRYKTVGVEVTTS